MAPEEREKMNALIQRIQEEQDPRKFTDLVEELNELIDQKRVRVDLAQKPSICPKTRHF